jgi:quercetin dioxygenase-like cupin family protein
MKTLRSAAALGLLTLAAACGGAASQPPPADLSRAQGFGQTALAAGGVDAFPAPPLYINVIDITQQPAGSITHKHIAGFVYVVTGSARMLVDGGPTLDIAPGHAGFVGTNVTHSHVDTGEAPNDWWFISLRPSALRTSTLVPGQKVLFSTDDLAPADLAGGAAYRESLASATLASGGRSAAHRHGGPALIFATSGSISVKLAGRPAATVAAGSGVYVPPGAVEQEHNPGAQPAGYLVFAATPAGAAELEDVKQVP